MVRFEPELAGHPDTIRWNAKYGGDYQPSFRPHPLAVQALAVSPPAGPALDLASGPSGSALLLAAAGHAVVAVDASDIALDLLGREAVRRGLADLVTLVHDDLRTWRPQPASYSLVLCTGYWDGDLFEAAAAAVRPGGLIGWEAFTTGVLQARPGWPPQWCLQPGQPASLLPAGYQVVSQRDLPGDQRQMLARRADGS